VSCFIDGIKDVSDFLSDIFISEETAKKVKESKPNTPAELEIMMIHCLAKKDY